MATWTAPATTDVLSEFTPQEAASIRGVQSADNLAAILARAVAAVRLAIESGGYALDADATKIPPGLHSECIAIARWRLLISLPQLKAMQTEERKKAFEDAEARLALIAAQGFNPGSPGAASVPATGSWGSENKLQMRTHPVPRPGVQITPGGSDYANPDEPADNS